MRTEYCLADHKSPWLSRSSCLLGVTEEGRGKISLGTGITTNKTRNSKQRDLSLWSIFNYFPSSKQGVIEQELPSCSYGVIGAHTDREPWFAYGGWLSMYIVYFYFYLPLKRQITRLLHTICKALSSWLITQLAYLADIRNANGSGQRRSR